MRTPQRYMSINTNVNWKLEGCYFETIDIKTTFKVCIEGKRLIVFYHQEINDEVVYKDFYPNTGNLGAMLIGCKIERLMNKWEKYNNYLAKYSFKHSKKEIETNHYYETKSNNDFNNED